LTSGPYWFSSKELLQKSSNGVGKEKKLYAKKVVQKGACLDCGLDFCMPYLIAFDSILSDFCCSMAYLK
jgi:hypothetical protein